MPVNIASIQQTPIFNFDNINVNSAEFQDYMTQLTQAVNNISLLLNMKETGYFDINELATSQFYYPVLQTPTSVPIWRPVLRTVYPFAMQNGIITPTQQIPHGLTLGANFQFVGIYGACNAPGFSALTLPFTSASGAAFGIEVTIDPTFINITTHDDFSAYTKCDIVLEYITNGF